MKMKKMIYLAFALLLLSANSMNAQVAIGTDPTLEPHPGAILDLGQVTGNNLGLLLPKVMLTAHDVWAPVEGTKADEIDGMMVFNESTSTENGLNGIGAYVWYDNSWHKLGLSGAADTPNIVTDIDDNSYKYACFGVAGCWMQENLKTTKYADGTAISYKNGVSNTNLNKKEYAYPNNAAANKTKLGLLYTWAAASNRTGISVDERNDPAQTQYQGVCPDGWHLPSDYEWSQLEEVIDKDAASRYASSTANIDGINYYEKPTSIAWRGSAGLKTKTNEKVSKTILVEPNGTSNDLDNNGFVGFLVGDETGTSSSALGFGEYARYWSSSCSASVAAWLRGHDADKDGLFVNTAVKYDLYSVRCKKDL